MEYGNVLKAIRIKAGLSQEEIAGLLNRSRSCISKIESNKKVVDMTTFMKWVDVTKSQEIAVAMIYGMDGLSIVQQILPFIVGGLILWL